MKSLIMITLFASFSGFTLASTNDLKNNYCKPITDSKRYISNNFSLAYPKTVKFECTYECKINNSVDKIVAISSINVNSIEDDAQNVVCQGVKVKRVSWGFDFAGVENFYAFDTQLVELKQFAFENINQKDAKNIDEKTHLINLKVTLNQIAGAYAQASASPTPVGKEFLGAANVLAKIANQLPENTTLLNSIIARIIISKGNISNEYKANAMIERVILQSANWRIPTHQF